MTTSPANSEPRPGRTVAWGWLALPTVLASLWGNAGLVSAGLGRRDLFTPVFLIRFGWPGLLVAAGAWWFERPGTRLAHLLGGSAAVLFAAYWTAIILQPRDNHDANLGLGLYPLVGLAALVLYALVFWPVRDVGVLTRR